MDDEQQPQEPLAPPIAGGAGRRGLVILAASGVVLSTVLASLGVLSVSNTSSANAAPPTNPGTSTSDNGLVVSTTDSTSVPGSSTTKPAPPTLPSTTVITVPEHVTTSVGADGGLTTVTIPSSVITQTFNPPPPPPGPPGPPGPPEPSGPPVSSTPTKPKTTPPTTTEPPTTSTPTTSSSPPSTSPSDTHGN
jgi:hypothetical protein